ncbi:hypothetical protein Tco_1079285 [Tanacetum coccineum]|uniref:Uncharacterized protein n=1 Tax=Tanacetum coccineum TaxID=301880 RepID=A0ABQ5HRV9_9ASTR
MVAISYRVSEVGGYPVTLSEESPEQHAGYSFSLIHGIVSLGSRLTPDKSTRYSSELHALCLVLGQPSDEANAFVSYISGTRMALALPDTEYSLRMTGGLLRGTLRDNIGPTPAGIIGSTLGGRGPLKVNVETYLTETTPSAREQIEGNLSALRSLLKEHNGMGNVSLIHLIFDDVEDRTRVQTIVTGKEKGDVDMKRPFKEAVKTP